KYQPPPRITRLSAVAGPCGSMLSAGASRYAAYQSDVHSHTLPCMSARPHGLSGNVPTGAGFCRYSPGGADAYGYLPLEWAWAVETFSPVQNGPVVPARHAYSHSASVGRR